MWKTVLLHVIFYNGVFHTLDTGNLSERKVTAVLNWQNFSPYNIRNGECLFIQFSEKGFLIFFHGRKNVFEKLIAVNVTNGQWERQWLPLGQVIIIPQHTARYLHDNKQNIKIQVYLFPMFCSRWAWPVKVDILPLAIFTLPNSCLLRMFCDGESISEMENDRKCINV